VSKAGAVVVNHDAGEALVACVASLRAEGVRHVVVVDNASSDDSLERLAKADADVRVVRSGRNLGYGAGANRGIAALDDGYVLVCNPDVVVHGGAVEALAEALDSDGSAGIVGPCILEPDGSRYPSARAFPSWVDAAGHALLGAVRPGNRFTRRYRMHELALDRTVAVDWVSGACFLARSSALEELGGFDEGYFMYLEDTDLCFRAHRAGYRVLYVPQAVVSHLQGLSTGRRPYRMLVAHHRSALRFAARTTTGWRRMGLPAVALLLGLRLTAVALRQAVVSWRGAAEPRD
jgi:N-acetylglucosaminyl-diphospho-decaprenol L-rhamnosyltransferase